MRCKRIDPCLILGITTWGHGLQLMLGWDALWIAHQVSAFNPPSTQKKNKKKKKKIVRKCVYNDFERSLSLVLVQIGFDFFYLTKYNRGHFGCNAPFG